MSIDVVHEPVEITSDGTDERIEVFKIDGESYTIPAKPRVNIVLKYLKSIKNGESDSMANAGLMIDMLGEEGYDALANHDGLAWEDFNAVLEICTEVAFGEMEAATTKGKS